MKHIKIVLTLTFLTFFSTIIFSQNPNDVMLLKESGKVVIGDTTQISTPGDYHLYVQSGILTERVKVALNDSSDWSDDEWENKPEISEIEDAINKNKHLPDMPSADNLVKNGYELQEMDAKLLAQIEWLWLHMIELDKENKLLKKKIEELSKEK